MTIAAVTNNTGAVTIACTRGNSGITLTVDAGAHAANATAPSARAMAGAVHGDLHLIRHFRDGRLRDALSDVRGCADDRRRYHDAVGH